MSATIESLDGLPDVTGLSVRHLLRLEAAIASELRQRGLVRTNNKPLGDVAEHVVWLARGGLLEPNSTKSHDITTVSGHRIQVKAMANRAAGVAARFSPFRGAGYQTAVFLVFNTAFDIVEAYEVEASRSRRTCASFPMSPVASQVSGRCAHWARTSPPRCRPRTPAWTAESARPPPARL